MTISARPDVLRSAEPIVPVPKVFYREELRFLVSFHTSAAGMRKGCF